MPAPVASAAFHFNLIEGLHVTHAHFAYGWVNPLMALGFGLAGSFLGLHCMMRARDLPPGKERNKWLILASLAIGGIGIWMMHFIAMIGFSVHDSIVRYDVAITAVSLLISILSVAFGLFVVGVGDASVSKILLGGPLTGTGVVAMHYTGMAAVNLSGTLHYDTGWVIASVIIAIVAATTALFFTAWVTTRGSLLIASLTMAVAVCGMHYSGMGAISVTISNRGLDPVAGVDPLLLLIPILLLATVVLIVLIAGVLGGQDEVLDAHRTEMGADDGKKKGGARRSSRRPEPETQEARPSTGSSFWDNDGDGYRDPVSAGIGQRRAAREATGYREPAVLPRPRAQVDDRRDGDTSGWG